MKIPVLFYITPFGVAKSIYLRPIIVYFIVLNVQEYSLSICLASDEASSRKDNTMKSKGEAADRYM